MSIGAISRRVSAWVLIMAVVVAAGVAPGVATAATQPSILSFAAKPSVLWNSPGTVTITASVNHATKCELWSNWPVKGLPETFSCRGRKGLVNVSAVGLNNNNLEAPVYYYFYLKAWKGRSSSPRSTVDVYVPSICANWNQTLNGEYNFILTLEATGSSNLINIVQQYSTWYYEAQKLGCSLDVPNPDSLP